MWDLKKKSCIPNHWGIFQRIWFISTFLIDFSKTSKYKRLVNIKDRRTLPVFEKLLPNVVVNEFQRRKIFLISAYEVEKIH